jgi:hypothetical protein
MAAEKRAREQEEMRRQAEQQRLAEIRQKRQEETQRLEAERRREALSKPKVISEDMLNKITTLPEDYVGKAYCFPANNPVMVSKRMERDADRKMFKVDIQWGERFNKSISFDFVFTDKTGRRVLDNIEKVWKTSSGYYFAQVSFVIIEKPGVFGNKQYLAQIYRIDMFKDISDRQPISIRD